MNGEQLQVYLREIDKKNSWGKNELKFLSYYFLCILQN